MFWIELLTKRGINADHIEGYQITAINEDEDDWMLRFYMSQYDSQGQVSHRIRRGTLEGCYDLLYAIENCRASGQLFFDVEKWVRERIDGS